MTRILVVDDEPDAAEIISDLLATMGHMARVAHNGRDAFRLACEFEPQIVLSDLNMPLMDGFELARAIRRTTFSTRPLLIALSAMVGLDVQARTQAAGFDAYIPKPADTNILLALVDDFSAR